MSQDKIPGPALSIKCGFSIGEYKVQNFGRQVGPYPRICQAMQMLPPQATANASVRSQGMAKV